MRIDCFVLNRSSSFFLTEYFKVEIVIINASEDCIFNKDLTDGHPDGER